MTACQVRSAFDLPCPERESGGLQCERLDPHMVGHRLSRHTIAHDLAGNGYPCEAIRDE